MLWQTSVLLSIDTNYCRIMKRNLYAESLRDSVPISVDETELLFFRFIDACIRTATLTAYGEVSYLHLVDSDGELLMDWFDEPRGHLHLMRELKSLKIQLYPIMKELEIILMDESVNYVTNYGISVTQTGGISIKVPYVRCALP